MVQLGESLQREVMLPQEGGQALPEWEQQTESRPRLENEKFDQN